MTAAPGFAVSGSKTANSFPLYREARSMVRMVCRITRAAARGQRLLGFVGTIHRPSVQVVLRKAGGQVARSVGVTSSGGAWSRSFSYSVAGQQSGTLEAVDFSAKDGSLVCIVQVRVTLRPPP